MASRKKQASATKPSSPSTPKTEGTKGQNLRLPKAYLSIIIAEAAALKSTRSYFLVMLFQRYQGGFVIERPTDAPSYTVTEEDLDTPGIYYWHCPPELRRDVDIARKRMGHLSLGQFAVQLVNHWLGTPWGPPIVPPESKPTKKSRSASR